LVDVVEVTVRDRIASHLKELGLSTHEALTYLTLLVHPEVTASTICKETSILDSKIYYALDGLLKKGMIMVQQGNPNIYRAMPPKEALANLKQELVNYLNQRIKEVDILVEQLTPIYDSAEKPEELELAYIIKGQKNIVNKMRDLIRTARKEITVFVSHPSVLKEIRDSLVEAQERRKVRLNMGVTSEVLETENLLELGEVRLLCYALGMIISDMETLLTFANWTSEAAVITQDRNLIRVCRDYYDNPVCCRKVNAVARARGSRASVARPFGQERNPDKREQKSVPHKKTDT